MAVINLVTVINAPVQRVFDLSRSIDLHKLSTQETNEEAVAGRTMGLINAGETVTWKAKHLFKIRFFTSKITGFESPVFFRDEMQAGDFKKFYHEHFFEQTVDEKTIMKDILVLEAPYGFLGKIAMFLFLKKYIERFLRQRNELIKTYAETDQWKKILTTDEQPN